jgi:hypothetical protein
MVMPASGAINLGGTASPVSVAQELSLGLTTTISMNDTAVRALAGAGASGTSWSMLSLYGKSSVKYNWYASLDSVYASDVDSGYGVAYDSSGNVYMAGTAAGTAGKQDGLIVKYSAAGVLQWQRKLIGAGYDYITGIGVDSSGNSYAIGYSNTNSAIYNMVLTKWNTSGVFQWMKSVLVTGFTGGYGISVDSYGNSYVVGAVYVGGARGYDTLFAKFDTSGNEVYAIDLMLNSTITQGYGIAETGGFMWITGYVGTGANNIFVAKINSTSGITTWIREIAGGSGGYDAGLAIDVDPNGNSYITGLMSNTTQDAFICSLDTNGNYLWGRGIINNSGSQMGYGVACDSSGNSYIVGTSGFIAKYNSSGVCQWSKSVGVFYTWGNLKDISCDGSHLYITGRGGYQYSVPGNYGGTFTYGANDICTMKIAVDGSHTLAVTAVTDAAVTLTMTTPTTWSGNSTTLVAGDVISFYLVPLASSLVSTVQLI